MTQTYSQAISLHLTSMQLPEALPGNTRSEAGGRPIANLMLRPGEPSEIIVQIKNLSDQDLDVTLQIEGAFPPQWCQIGTEGSTLRAAQQMDAVLYFQIPSHFFEQQDALNPGEALELNYSGRLCVYSVNRTTGQRQLEFSTFHLFIRPRSLYLDFLPAIYREIDFVGRFLKIFEETFEPAVHSLDTLWAYLDPLTAPQTLLPFLSHWVGWVPQPYLSLERQRYLIRNALQIYRWRGTRRGLRFYLHLATGLPLDHHLDRESSKHIAIHESFHRGFVLGIANLGQDARLGGSRPYHFSVHLRPDHPDRLIDEPLVRTVIEQEKPAFCTYDLHIQDPPTSTPPPSNTTEHPHPHLLTPI